MNSETKICKQCKKEFVIAPIDFEYYAKVEVPPPTFCPKCRFIRRLLWRNERTFYRRKCEAPGHEEMMASYRSTETPAPVYCQEFFHGDGWDPLDFGRTYDFSRPFFEQFHDLLSTVPRDSLGNDYSTLVRSEYSNWSGRLKDCYIVTDADEVENAAYCCAVMQSKDCYDCNTITGCELCYESFNLRECYKTFYCVNCQSSSDLWFSKNCSGCISCFGCMNLRGKSYHIFNKPYDKISYEKEVAELLKDSWQSTLTQQERAKSLWSMYPQRFAQGLKNVNSSGDYVSHSKNLRYGYLASDVEDSSYIALTHQPSTKDCYDYADWGGNVERCYEVMTAGLGAVNIKFSNITIKESKNIEYSYNMRNCSDCFGCVGLKKKQYCILNKQYTENEYKELIPKMKRHMDEMPYTDKQGIVYKYGEFFPSEIAHFAYNETAAQEFFPLTRDEAIAQGFRWHDRGPRQYTVTLKPDGIPDHIADIKDDILNQVIGCAHEEKCNEQCTGAFKLIPSELMFYRRFNLPIPRLCPNCRHYARFRHRNGWDLYPRACDCGGNNSKNATYKNIAEHFHKNGPCTNEFETSYNPSRPEIVYCESCYQNEVI